MKTILLLGVVLLLSGCATAVGYHDMLPPSKHYTNLAPTPPGEVDLFQKGDAPAKPCVRIATIAVHGNGHATKHLLEDKLTEEAGKLGADLVIVTQYQVTNDQSIGTYGGGIMTSTRINTPHLYGVACKYSRVLLGVFLDKKGVIEYVTSGSIAEKHGLKEGDKVVAINGKFLNMNDFTLEEEVNIKSPGDKIKIEYVNKDHEKIAVDIVL